MKNKKYFISCGKFFDGKNEELKEDIKIIVEGDRIKAVGQDLEQPDDAELINLSHLTVTPGLIDAHVHYGFVGPDEFITSNITDTDEMRTLNTLFCAQRSLEGGFTTVRIVGNMLKSFGTLDVKRAIDRQMFPGSRLVVAPHGLGTSGGHGDASQNFSSNPWLSDRVEEGDPFTGNGADFFKMAVRKQVKYGADLIKIMATGGFASPNDAPDEMHLDNDELKAIIDTANALGVPVTAHAYTSELTQNLVNMGITGIEHGSLIDEETADLMEKKGVYLVCTFIPYEEIVNLDEEKLAMKNKPYIEKLKKHMDQLRRTRKMVVDRILNSDMIIGYGTDMVTVYNNFECWREFKVWREAGIPALRTLRAATSVNAEILQRSELGSIEIGKIADIVGWSRDILEDKE
ncbi:MAG: amidohydrolase family protein, partial [Ignavibacteria bacterium]|nr:amidohydrolase family protein [Ignavibacteria bacterium]